MTCSDVERVLPELFDDASDDTFPPDLDAHVKSCPACSDLVSDLKLIASEARQLAATEGPAPRVWVRIAAELRAEGLISDSATREPKSAPRPTPVPASGSPRWRWRALWLAPAAAAVLAAGAYVISYKQVVPQVAQQAPTPQAPAPVIPTATPPSVPATAPQQVAKKPANPTGVNGRVPAVEAAVEPEPSAEDQQFLSVVSTLGPSMRATYESQLNAVNADIRETQAYVDRNPGDADARQHLMDAFQQKALLYQIALDRIQ